MKINVLRLLLLPWMSLFFLVMIAIVGMGSVEHLDVLTHPFFNPILGIAILVCIYLNFETVSKAGIWIAHGIPKIRRTISWRWLQETILASFFIYIVFRIGEYSWIPIYWQGFAIPILSFFGMLFLLRGLVSPILSWCSRRTFTRLAAMTLITPLLVVIPTSAIYLGRIVLSAYQVSRPEPIPIVALERSSNHKIDAPLLNSGVDKKDNPESNIENPYSEKAKKLQELAQAKHPCHEESASILSALSVKNSEEVAYWAIKALSCSDIKRIVSLTKLIDLMSQHHSENVRALAIRTIGRFPSDEVQKLGYLLIKRMTSKESPIVIEAATSVLSRQGPEEYLMTIHRMKDLLENPLLHQDIARIIMKTLKRDDILVDYVRDNLGATTDANLRAMGMICTLPNKDRIALETKIPQILKSLQTGDNQDPAKQALECLGNAGFIALENEIKKPQFINRELAARTLSAMDLHQSKTALETFQGCLDSKSTEASKWCSQGLGKIGAPALPRIVDLLKSKDEKLKNFGEQALQNFDDPNAKEDLLKIRAENSGWTATQRNLKFAKVIDTALIRISNRKNANDSEIDTKSSEVK